MTGRDLSATRRLRASRDRILSITTWRDRSGIQAEGKAMPKIRHQRKRPATQEERNAMTFAPINAEFDWTNEDWALTHLPVVRLALATVGHDDRGPEGVMSNIARAGGAVGLLDSFASTKQH